MALGDVGQLVEAREVVIEPLDEKLGLSCPVVHRPWDRWIRPGATCPAAIVGGGASPATRVSTRALLHAMDHLSRSAADLAAMIDTLANAGVQPVSVR